MPNSDLMPSLKNDANQLTPGVCSARLITGPQIQYSHVNV